MISQNVEYFEVSVDNVKEKIKEWYDKDKYHYVTINAVDNGGNITLDWIFFDYKQDKWYVFRAENVAYETFIPSLTDVIPSSWIAEWELVDLFGLNVENTPKGLFIKDPNIVAPLRKDSK
ncbi:NADH-quinone oxidoreductase subunit C [Caminibacter sp.]